MSKVKILIIFGTRPEAIKMAPVIHEFQNYPDTFEVVICVTAQHREMLDQVLDLFKIKPHIDLGLMQNNQGLETFASNAMIALGNVIRESDAQLVLVQGDTTTAMVAALASFYQKVPVGHIEAGLRTNDMFNPFPEEMNRRLISELAVYHFAPTNIAAEALEKEGIAKENIFLTGNTVVDSLHWIRANAAVENFAVRNAANRKMILVTAHRRENFGRPIENICNALNKIVENNKNVEIVYPVHLNPNIQEPVHRILSNKERIQLIPPVQYQELVNLLNNCYIVLTDSGGIQEEAPAFGKPVLVLRETTERPEGIEANVAKLIGTDTERIIMETEVLLNNNSEYSKMAKTVNPYGDGMAARRIVNIIKKTMASGGR